MKGNTKTRIIAINNIGTNIIPKAIVKADENIFQDKLSLYFLILNTAVQKINPKDCVIDENYSFSSVTVPSLLNLKVFSYF